MPTDSNTPQDKNYGKEPQKPENFIQNGKGKQLAAIVAALLSHYWTDDIDRPARRQQILDWVHDLYEFPIGAVEGAVITWRQRQNRRPTPADIRKLILPEPPKPDEGGGKAFSPFPEPAPISLADLAKHRQAVAPLWDLVRRARNGEDPELLVAERKRLTREMFERDPDLKRINNVIENHYKSMA